MQPLILTEPEQPFWGFAELFLTAAVFMAALIGAVTGASAYLHLPAESGFWNVAEESLAYAVGFLALKLLFKRHGRPVLDSLAWTKTGPFSTRSLIIAGVGLSLVVVALQYVLLTPEVETPFERMVSDPVSRVAVSLFGITLGPMIEELLFRGFLQPVLVSAAGVLPGILLTSVLFGALHLTQNAFVWQSGLLIMLVGFVLGTVRHVSGSTRASTVVHVSYNSLPFIALLFSSGHK